MRRLKFYKTLYVLFCIVCIIFLYLLIIYHIMNIKAPSVNYLNKITITASDNKENYKKESSLSLIMVGDALIHGSVYHDAKINGGYDFTKMLDNITPYIQSYDLAFYNQESILGGTELGLSSYPRFNSPFEVGDAFRYAGFNLVSLANNHTLDRGEQAITNSKNYWNKFDEILTAGSYKNKEEQEKIKIKSMNDITYTLLSYTDTTNGLTAPNGKEYLVNRYNEEKVKEDIEQIREKVDLLLVSMHFGDEYNHTPTQRQKQIATYLASLGVDIVIGHHPHVVQPIEFINDTMVIYSLGNFISAQQGIEKLTGLMVNVDVKKETIGTNSIISLENVGAEVVYTASDNKKGYRSNFEIYRYQDLTEDILPKYREYQEKYLEIAINNNFNIKAR